MSMCLKYIYIEEKLHIWDNKMHKSSELDPPSIAASAVMVCRWVVGRLFAALLCCSPIRKRSTGWVCIDCGASVVRQSVWDEIKRNLEKWDLQLKNFSPLRFFGWTLNAAGNPFIMIVIQRRAGGSGYQHAFADHQKWRQHRAAVQFDRKNHGNESQINCTLYVECGWLSVI